MCGIIGYTGNRSASPLLFEALSNLDYRGYDSSGIAVMSPVGQSIIRKSSGKLSNLKAALSNGMPKGNTGIGHTRWATHGSPTDSNAHPHTGCSERVMVVHNGIVENYSEIKEELIKQGHKFGSQTDSEVIPHLIESHLAENYSLEESVRFTARKIKGANVVVVICTNDPTRIMGFRIGNAGGIVVGYGDDEMMLASDLPALLPHTRKVVYLSPTEMVSITPASVTYMDTDGRNLVKSPSYVPYDTFSAAKGEYKHFMLKEISEQPENVIDALRGRALFDKNVINLADMPFTDEEIMGFERVILIGMGTSLHAAMVGRTWMESLARIPSEVDNASEFRYRDPVLNEKTLIISVSQSGETADTLAAMEKAKQHNVRQITLCNYPGTQSTLLAEGTLLIRAGLEISVAASKTFVCSMLGLYLLSLHMAHKRGVLSDNILNGLLQELAHLPDMMGTMLRNQEQYEVLARQYFRKSDFLYLGRGINYPLAMEGALKLKEVSYIHAEGYPAGEMKHGPISLIDENMPVVALIPHDDLYEKMVSSVNEVKARGGIVIAIASEGDSDITDKVDHVIYIPDASKNVTPILMAVPMQLLAYHMAVRRGCDVDQPRNLAKSVTVE